MKAGGIDGGRIEAMLAQLKAAAGAAQARPAGLQSPLQAPVATGTPKVNFADALKSQLDSVSALQKQAEKMETDFTLGDDRVNLSDVMIAGQKAGIAFQTTLQVRNKLVAAYHDVMNMQV